MFKLFVACVLLAVAAVYSAPHGIPLNADEAKNELTAAGISETAAAGIVAIGEKYKERFEAAKEDHAAKKQIFEEMKQEVDTYIKTQPEADQTAYTTFMDKKKAEMEEHQ